MNPMDPNEVEALRRAANVAHVLPDIMPEIESMMRSTESTVYAKIAKGELTPEQALSYWMEMNSYHRLANRLRTTAAKAEKVTDRRSQ